MTQGTSTPSLPESATKVAAAKPQLKIGTGPRCSSHHNSYTEKLNSSFPHHNFQLYIILIQINTNNASPIPQNGRRHAPKHDLPIYPHQSANLQKNRHPTLQCTTNIRTLHLPTIHLFILKKRRAGYSPSIVEGSQSHTFDTEDTDIESSDSFSDCRIDDSY